MISKEEMQFERCQNGHHSFVEISRKNLLYDGEEEIIVWCRICGCISIDERIKDQILPGAVMPLRVPEISKKLVN